MKIQSVQNYKRQRINSSKTNNNLPELLEIQKETFHKNVYFGMMGCGCNYGKLNGSSHTPKWSARLLRILERTDSEMRDFSEYFHDQNDDAIQSITRAAHNWSSTNAQNAASRLIKFVQPIREAKLKMEQRRLELEFKEGLGRSNLTEQKLRIYREFISLIAAEKKGKEPLIKNGILIHGTSGRKDEFINWLIESAGIIFKSMQHDSNNPTRTIDDIINIAENSELAFKHSRTRTLVRVKDLDKLLTDKNSAEAIDNINEFKSIAEDLSPKYHTTIITQTDKSLDDFEPATIASNRLGIHVDLKDGISEEELKELETIKAEIKRLEDKASSASYKFKS